MRKALVVGALLALTGAAFGQPVTQNQVTGNECWSAGQGPGGPSQFLCLSVVRSGTGNVILATATASFTLTTNAGNTIIAAQPSAITITMPPNPVVDGSIYGICNGTNAAWTTNAVTVAANTGQTMVPTGALVTLTTLAAGSCARYQWNQSGTSWYRVQ
jgi:hypothetical protein